LDISYTKASDFEGNIYLKNRCGQQTTTGRQTRGSRHLLLTSDFQIEASFKIESFYGSRTQN